MACNYALSGQNVVRPPIKLLYITRDMLSLPVQCVSFGLSYFSHGLQCWTGVRNQGWILGSDVTRVCLQSTEQSRTVNCVIVKAVLFYM